MDICRAGGRSEAHSSIRRHHRGCLAPCTQLALRWTWWSRPWRFTYRQLLPLLRRWSTRNLFVAGVSWCALGAMAAATPWQPGACGAVAPFEGRGSFASHEGAAAHLGRIRPARAVGRPGRGPVPRSTRSATASTRAPRLPRWVPAAAVCPRARRRHRGCVHARRRAAPRAAAIVLR